MDSRRLIEYYKTPRGKSVIFGVAFLIFCVVIYSTKSREAKRIPPPSDNVIINNKREIKGTNPITRFVPTGISNHNVEKKIPAGNGLFWKDDILVDGNGNPIRDKKGQVVTKNMVALDANGRIAIDKNGKPILNSDASNYVLDSNGKLVLDNQGKAIKKTTGAPTDTPGKISRYLNNLHPGLIKDGLVRGVKKPTDHNQINDSADTSISIEPMCPYNDLNVVNELDTERFAPTHRLIICELVNTVDSSRLNSPVIALVMEDVWHEGVKVIQAGTEVHGWASKSSMRDRIAADGQWRFVWRDTGEDSGKELTLRALALNYTKVPGKEMWDITDGSAGLKGYVVGEKEWAKLMAIATEFLKGVGEGMVTTRVDSYGDQTTQTYGGEDKDMLGMGLANAADMYAKIMMETIERDGAFVRVPAGTVFYLYTLETIDMSKASIGGEKQNAGMGSTGMSNPGGQLKSGFSSGGPQGALKQIMNKVNM